MHILYLAILQSKQQTWWMYGEGEGRVLEDNTLKKKTVNFEENNNSRRQ